MTAHEKMKPSDLVDPGFLLTRPVYKLWRPGTSVLCSAYPSTPWGDDTPHGHPTGRQLFYDRGFLFIKNQAGVNFYIYETCLYILEAGRAYFFIFSWTGHRNPNVSQ